MTVGEYFERHHLPRLMETREQAEDYLSSERPKYQNIGIANAVLYLMGHKDHILLRCYDIMCVNCWFRNNNSIDGCEKRMRDYVVGICIAGKRESVETLL